MEVLLTWFNSGEASKSSLSSALSSILVIGKTSEFRTFERETSYITFIKLWNTAQTTNSSNAIWVFDKESQLFEKVSLALSPSSHLAMITGLRWINDQWLIKSNGGE